MRSESFSRVFWWPVFSFPRSFRHRISSGAKECIYADLGESFHMIVYYLLSNIVFDTAENEPCKVCPLSVYRSPKFST